MPVPPQFKKGGKPKPGGKPGDKDAKSKDDNLPPWLRGKGKKKGK